MGWTENVDTLPEEVTMLHARFGQGEDPDVPAFCGMDGSPDHSEYVVNLGHPKARASMVTCPECKEWIHA